MKTRITKTLLDSWAYTFENLPVKEKGKKEQQRNKDSRNKEHRFIRSFPYISI